MSDFSWDSPTFGQVGHNVHEGISVPDAHDLSEAAAEAAR